MFELCRCLGLRYCRTLILLNSALRTDDLRITQLSGQDNRIAVKVRNGLHATHVERKALDVVSVLVYLSAGDVKRYPGFVWADQRLDQWDRCGLRLLMST